MKRLILIITAAASVAATLPLATPAFADDDRGRGRGERSEGRSGRGPERGDERRGGQDRGNPDRGRQDRDDRPRYVDERPRYDDRRRDDGPAARPNYMRRPEGEAVRRSGPYLPDNYRNGVVDDYRRYRLRPPPQGYAWVRMGNGFALVEMGSGRIFDRVD